MDDYWNYESIRDIKGYIKVKIKNIMVTDFLSNSKEQWYVASNNIDVYHYGKLPKGSNVITGQPNLQLFNSEMEMLLCVPVKFRI